MERKKFGILLLLVLCLGIIFCSLNVSAEESSSASRKYVVVLDPGHGGVDSGAEATYNGKRYYEADMTWKIASYLKKELQKESNIKVYITRKQNECPDLSDRVDYAAKYKADLLVSLHINSADVSNAYGACVLVSQGTYRPYLAEEEKVFGTYVMDELVKLGLYKRNSNTGGLLYKLSQDGSLYPNGRLKDYYQIVNNSVLRNLPGVIIEHAFISNYSDWKNYLSSNAKLKKLAQADARAVVKYVNRLAEIEKEHGLTNKDDAVNNGWVCRYGKYFYYKDGEVVTNKLFSLDGEYYYVDTNGIRQTGWITYNNKKYYFDADGKAHKKWLTLDGKKYYFHKSKAYMYTGVKKTAAGNNYVFGSDGKLQKNTWYETNGKKYYVASNGIAVKKYKKINGNYYYFDPIDSYMYTSKLYKTSTGNYVYAQSNGVLYNKGFISINSKTYYFKPSGVAYKGYKKINNKYYFFDRNNAYLYKSKLFKTENGNYLYAQSDGVLYDGGLKKIGSKSYFFKKDAIALKGWKKMRGKWYYFKKSNRSMLKNCDMMISGKMYSFDANGVCISGKE